MASIQKYSTQKGERWMYVIDTGINPVTGKRERTVKRGFEKERDATRASRHAEYEFEKWNVDFKNKITFQELTEEWFKMYEKSGVKQSTIDNRISQIKKLNKYFGFLKVKDITQVQYQRFLNEMQPTLAKRSLIVLNSTAKMIFTFARKMNVIVMDPTEFTRIPRINKSVEELENEIVTDEYFEKDELKAFLDTSKTFGHMDDHFIFSMLAWTGMRAGEFLALKWSDIDFEKKTISITKTLYNKGKAKEFSLTTPKTMGSVRLIDVEDEIITLLKRRQLLQKEFKLVVGKEYADFGFVLARHDKKLLYGYPYHIRLINSRIKSIIDKMEEFTKDLSSHSFRHTHTSLLAEVGVPLELIMDRLGHDSDETTTRVYLHVTKDRKKEASQKFGELMRNL